MSLSNNSTPSQSIEIVDLGGSCKKDNSEPVISFHEFVKIHLTVDCEGNYSVPEFEEDYLNLMYRAYCAGFKAGRGGSQ